MNQFFALMMIYSMLLMAFPARGLAAGNQRVSNIRNEQTQTVRTEENESSQTSEIKQEKRSTDDFAPETEGQTATELANGDVLIVSGGTAKIYFAASNTFGATGAPLTPRENHAAVRLNDGRVLITGGSQGKTALRSAEIFDPASGTFTAAAEMNFARSGHTATVLPNGKVLIVGWSSTELYDPASNTFETIGSQMNVPRSNHSSVLLNDGRLLIVGGRDEKGNNLSSAEIFNTSTGEFELVQSSLAKSRVNPVLRVLHDGKIQIIGGDDSSLEIFDPAKQEFGAFAAILDKTKFPTLFEQILKTPTRAAIVGSKNIVELGQSRTALKISENSDAAQSQLFQSSNATISTDSLSYPPKTSVVVTGAGFQPNETVELVFYETPKSDQKKVPSFAVQADENGNFVFQGFTPDVENAVFIIAAIGQISGIAAQTTVSSLSPGTLGNYNPLGLAGSEASLSPTDVAANVTFSPLTRGTGILPNSGANSFNSNNWTSGTSIDTTDYYQFTITPSACYRFGASQMSLGLQKSSSGPANIALRSSLDNYASDIWTQTLTNNGTNRFVISLSGVTGLQNSTSPVTFRIYGYGSGGTTGTLRITAAGTAPNTTVGIEVDGSVASTSSVSVSPTSAAFTYGDNAVFTSSVTGTLSSPKWQYSSTIGGTYTDISGATSRTLTLTAPQVSQSGFYRVVYTDACNAAIASNPVQLNVSPRTLSPNVTVNNKTYDGTNAAVIATRTLTGGIVGTDDIVLTGGTAVFDNKNAGTAKNVSVSGLSLSGTSAVNYLLSATTASATANIDPKNLTFTATGINKVYDGTTAATVNLTDDRISGDSLTFSHTAEFDNADVGTNKVVTVSGISITGGTDASNYTITNNTATTNANITQAALTATATAADKIYDGNANASATITLSPTVPNVSATYTTAEFTDKNVGAGKTVNVSGITLTGAGAGNYSVNATATATASIMKRDLTVSATAQNKQYNGNADAQVSLTSDKLENDVVLVSFATANFDNKNVGTGKTVTVNSISISGTDAGNYNLLNTTATATADISQALLMATVTVNSKTYDGNNSATIASRSLNGVVNGDSVTVSGGTATFADKNAGMNKTVSITGLILGGTDAGNYSFSGTASTNANIAPKPLTVTASGINKSYDGTTSATVNLSDDRLTGDVLTLNYASAIFDTANVGTGKIISVSGIEISGADAGNYAPNTEAQTTADITAVQLTATVTVNNKVYDGSTSATIASRTLNGVVNGDDVTVSGGTAMFSDKNVGNGKTVSVSGLTLGGTDAANYTFGGTASTTADITPRNLTVSATASSRVYNGDTDASVMLSDDRVSGDVFDVQYTSASFDNKNVGMGKTVTVSGISISGTDAGNYSLTSMTATALADVTPKSLTAAATAQDKIYDGNTSATASVNSNDVVSGDALTFAFTSATFDTADVGTGKTVTVSGISIGGADAGNYSLQNTTAITSANITIASQEIIFPQPASPAAFNSTFSINPTATSGLTVTVVATGSCSYLSGTVTMTSGIGNCVLTASQSGNGNYSAAADVVRTVSASKIGQTITFAQPASPVAYNGTFSINPTSDSNLAVSVSASGGCDISGNTVTMISGTDACVLTASQGGNDNYNAAADVVRTVGAALASSTTTITSTNPGTLRFDETYAVTATTTSDGTTVISAAPSSVCAVESSNVVRIVAGSGTCDVTATTAATSNFASSSATQSITAQKAAATLSFIAPTLTQTFDGTPRVVSVETTPADLTGVSVTYESTLTPPTNAGTYSVTASLNNNNYAASSISGTLVVSRATVAISINDPGAKTYGDAPFSVSSTDSGSSNSVQFSSQTESVCSVSGSTVTIHNAGDCTIRAFQPGDSNYQDSEATRTISVSKKTLIVLIGDQTVTYGDTLVFTPTFDGFVNGDTISVLSVPPNSLPTCDVGSSFPDAGTRTITCAGGSNNNYSFDLTDTGTLTVNPAPASSSTVTVTFVDSAPYVYRGTPFTATARVTGAGGLDQDITSSIQYTGCTNAGVCRATATFSDGNHLEVSSFAEITIEKATPTVSISGGTFTFDGMPHPATGSVTGVGSPSPENLGTPTFSYTPGSPTAADAPVNAGTYTVVGSFAGNGNYNSASSTPATITIGKANQTITFDAIPDKYYGEPDFTVSPTASSGLPVSLSATSSPIAGLCTVLGFTIRIVGAGTCTITASQGGNGNFNPASSVARSFTISTINDPVTASVANPAVRATLPSAGPVTVNVPVVLGDVNNRGFTSFEFTVEFDNAVLTPVANPVVVSSGDLADGFNPFANAVGNRVAVQGNRFVPMSGSGRLLSLQFTANAIGCSNISFVLPPSNEPQQPIVFNTGTNPVTATSGRVCIAEDTTTTVSFGSGPFVYSGSPFTATATTTGNRTGVSQTPVTIDYNGTDCTNVTTTNGCSATASYAGDDTHNASISTASSITIEKAPLTVTANNQTITFGQPDPPFTFTYSGFVNNEGDSVIDTPPTCSVSGQHSNAGTYPIVCAGGADNNYRFSYVSGTLTVNQATPTITWNNPADIVYGTALSGTQLNATASVAGSFVYSPAAGTVLNVGTHTLSVTFTPTDTVNYTTQTASVSINVTRASLTVTANNKSRPFNTANPAFDATITGFVNGETLSTSGVTGAAECSSAATPSSPVSDSPYAIICTSGTLAASNYSFTFVEGQLTITRSSQTITFDALSGKTYGDADFTVSATASSGLSVDFASLTESVCTVSGSSVHIVSAGICTIEARQAGDSNYEPAPPVSQSFTVAKATATVSINGGTFTYDGNPHPATGTVTGVNSESLGTPDFTYTPPGDSTAPVNVGTYSAVGSFAGNGNYNPASSAPATIEITKADQTINFDPLNDKLIGSPDFNVSATVTAPTSGGSTNPVTFSTTTTSVCTVTPQGLVHLVYFGQCTITASKLGDGNYNDATDVSRSFNVIPYTDNLNVSLPATPASSFNGEPFAVPVSISETGQHAINTITFDLLYSSIWNPATTFITGTTCGGAVSTTPISGGVQATITAPPSLYLSGSCSVVFNFRSNNTGSSSFVLNNFVYSSDTPTAHTGGANVTGSPYSVTVTNGSIAGTITNFHNGLAVPDVLLSAAGLPPVSGSTSSSGFYELFGFGNGSYTVTPSKPAETRTSATSNGSILSNDVTMIQRHRVGLCPVELDGNGNCPRPWNAKMQAAADVDQNTFVQSFDASLIQQFRAGIPNVVNQTGFWKFTDASKTYVNVFTPKTLQDYTALLLGDVDGSWSVPIAPIAVKGGRTKSDEKSDEKSVVTEYVKPQVADVAPMAVNVTLPTASLPTNAIISQDIIVGNTTGQGVSSYDFDIVYNPAVVQPALSLVNKQDTLSANMSVVANVVAPGRLAVSASGINSLSDSGVLLKVIWRTVGNSGDTTSITFDPFIFNGGTPSATVVNGQITLSVATAQQATISGRVTATDSKGLNGAIVTITGADGQSFSVRTNNFGAFTANGFPIGQTYIISVRAKGYTFAPQTLNLLHDEENLEIIGQP